MSVMRLVGPEMPALLTRMSMRPNAFIVSSAILAQSASFETSVLHLNRARAEAFEFGAGLLHRFDGARRDHDLRARRAVLQRDLFADSVAAAGDDCDFVREFVHGNFFLGDVRESITAPTLVASRFAHNARAKPCLTARPPNII